VGNANGIVWPARPRRLVSGPEHHPGQSFGLVLFWLCLTAFSGYSGLRRFGLCNPDLDGSGGGGLDWLY